MRAVVFSLASLMVVAIASLGAGTIRVHTVDGRNGKTITNERVQVWINERKGALNLVPRENGIAEFEAPAGASIRIESNLYMDCRPFAKAAPRPTYSADDIKNSGLATPNICGKAKAEARPGELIFFVRPLHWWEVIRR
jgi:hypothetical protein